MITSRRIKEQTQEVIDGLQRRGINNAEELIKKVIFLDDTRKKYKNTLDDLLRQIKLKTGIIERKLKNNEDVSLIKKEVLDIKNDAADLKNELVVLEEELVRLLYDIPNVPNVNIPDGASSAGNKVVYQTAIPSIEHKVPHYEIVKQLDIIDFELGTKLTGTGFPVYKNFGARLQRALINFFLDEAREHGFKEYGLPLVCNDASFYGTGQMPDKEKQMYKVEDGFHLIPTAEVPLTNLYRDVILEEEDMPIKLTGYTPCFRREAGSWGKNVRGLNRLHQFDKIEIVEIVRPEDSYAVLEKMRAYVEGLVKKLELPYRVLCLCAGDLGFNSAFTYDIEVYSLGQDMWLEASSISNFEDYQANRLKLRYKTKDGEKKLAHTLNGSALALPRIMAALIEKNYDGVAVKVPKVLEKYF